MANNSWSFNLTYEKYVEHYFKGQSLLEKFDQYTDNQYTEITDRLRKSYTTNYIYFQIIHLPILDSLKVLLSNLSFFNNIPYSKKLIKTFLWRIIKRRKILS